MADRFFTPDALGPGEYALTGPEAHHLSAVRRFAPGDEVVLFNGDGHDYPAHVLSVGKRTVVLSVLAPVVVDRELPFPLVVGSALPKGDRADFLIEKLTELGVTRFVPLLTARAVVQPKPAVVEKFAHRDRSEQAVRAEPPDDDRPAAEVVRLRHAHGPTRVACRAPHRPRLGAVGGERRVRGRGRT